MNGLIAHVKQKGNLCGVACLAMVCGYTLQQTLERFKISPNSGGVWPDELMLWLRQEGFRPIQYASGNRFLREKHLYILTVPSLNTLGMSHYIVYFNIDGRTQILDPNEGRKGQEFYTELKSYTEAIDCGALEKM